METWVIKDVVITVGDCKQNVSFFASFLLFIFAMGGLKRNLAVNLPALQKSHLEIMYLAYFVFC